MFRLPIAALLAALLLSACVVEPGYGDRDDLVIAPALPGVVILDADPYYYQHGFYYYYHDDSWSYSHDRHGPWRDLPRDRYPGQVRFKGHDGDRDRDRDRPWERNDPYR